jgi:hypothetical protein
MRRLVWLLPLAMLAACDKTDADKTPASASGASAASPKPAETAKTEPAKAPNDNGKFSAFGKFINEAGEAVLAAARGEKPDAKWGLEPLDGSDADKLQGAKKAFTTAEIEAMHDKNGYLRTNVIVFPDNRVRWVKVEHRSRRAVVKPTEGLDTIAPVLAATTKSVLAALSGDTCELPLLSKAEVEATPGGQFHDVKPLLDKTCAAMKGKGDGWIPRYDDFTLILEAGGKVVTIRSGLQVKDGKLVLDKPRVR